MVQTSAGVGDAGDTVKGAWDETRKTPIGQINEQLDKWFTNDPTTWTAGTEKVAVSTFISSMAVVAGSGLPLVLLPFMMPLVAAIAGVAVDKFNDVLHDLGIRHDRYCNHAEDLVTHHYGDRHWIHYPGRFGVREDDPDNGVTKNEHYAFGAVPGGKGWGRMQLDTVSPALSDYPWVQNLASGLGPDLGKRVLRIPAAAPKSFEDYWYRIYQRVKEINYLQDCIELESGDAAKQEEAALISWVKVWNETHAATPGDTVFPGAAGAGDDALLAPHADAITIHRGAYRQIGGTIRKPTGAIVAGPTAGSPAATAAIVVGGTAATAFLASVVYAKVRHESVGAVWSRLWRKTRATLQRKHP